ncbi:MAG: N-6 DNA methylase [Minisyncoccales bacterium]
MNTEIKRHIDGARQVLVGVVPNPTSQIEQITNALIYKFMDDMDQAAIRQGDRPAFFVGELERYAWTRLMDARIGNQERMNLYSEALVKFSQAEQLPELFRGIFKSAFLPYRSPETLGLFLKEINFFDYSHPEELGNAYEYLLSIMSSQGDAGQFRTPRHIIDFIVDVVNPAKGDKVLDPACGTGGFLVKSYQHILEQLGKKDADGNNPKPLTPDERKKLMNNFEGYDIDPAMVRISQVNMYLHQFKNPKIYQYDTLSNDDRWGDKFDVILANPPFMSPRGGIQPHHKFSVQSSRSEVLFVDYIMNHLRPKGRAGIIVPEGIIFQSGASHKQLRKNLVEDGLYCVASLPSGVFAPYSGVKTSILFFDNERAISVKEILFVKIQNDGFDLGATKRPIAKNDLPQALEIINLWKTGKKSDSKPATYVEKSNIGKSGDYNLSGDRYRVATDYSNAKWPMVELGEVLNYEQPTKYLVQSVDYKDEYLTPVLTAGKTFILGYTNEKEGVFHDNLPVIIFDDFTTATKFVDFPFKVKSSAMKILHAKKDIANIRYVFQVMQHIDFTFSEHKRFWISEYSKIKIPLPPIEFQQEIMDQIEVLEDEKKFNKKEDEYFKQQQNRIIANIWNNSELTKINYKNEAEIRILISGIADTLGSIGKNLATIEAHILVEHLILSIRELGWYIEKYFFEDLNASDRKKIIVITKIRNAICHRSSPLNWVNGSIKITGSFNFKNGDVEFQYGEQCVYLLQDLIVLYKKFATLVDNKIPERNEYYKNMQKDKLERAIILLKGKLKDPIKLLKLKIG